MLDLLISNYKLILSSIAIILTFYSFFPYITSILAGKIKPHVFSWIIWALTTFIVFLAQLSDNGGAGAWPVGISGTITFYIAFLAYMKRGDIQITRSDWIFLTMALLAIPVWVLTDNALFAVIILTSIDLIGFLPTMRKAYFFPHDEQLRLFILSFIRYIIAACALEHYSLITLLFPVSVATMCIIVITMVTIRRRIILPT